MFALILIFYGGTADATPSPSAHVLLYPTQAACLAEANSMVSYEQGVEAGKPAPSQVRGWCLPVQAMHSGPTT